MQDAGGIVCGDQTRIVDQVTFSTGRLRRHKGSAFIPGPRVFHLDQDEQGPADVDLF